MSVFCSQSEGEEHAQAAAVYRELGEYTKAAEQYMRASPALVLDAFDCWLLAGQPDTALTMSVKVG